VNRFSSSFRFACLGIVGLLGVVAPAAAQQVSEARLQELMAQAKLLAGDQAATPSQVASQAATRPVVNLTMDDTVKLTIDNNIDISVQRLNPQIQDYALAQVRAAYKPSVSGTLGDRSSRAAGTSQLSGGSVVNTGTYTWNTGVTQSLPWIGTSASVNFSNNRQNTDSNNATFNPTYSSNVQFSVTQPLMRNRSIDANRQSIQTTQIAR
jgi:hypothetical protein